MEYNTQLFTDIHDANYSTWEDPFAPEYEIIDFKYTMQMLISPDSLKHNIIIQQPIGYDLAKESWKYVF